MVFPFRPLFAQLVRHSRCLENIPRHRNARHTRKLPAYSGWIDEKDGVVARRVDWVFTRPVGHSDVFPKQKLFVELVDLRSTSRPQSDMMDPGCMVFMVQYSTLRSRLNSDVTVRKWKAGHVVCETVSDVQCPETLVPQPPEHPIIEFDRVVEIQYRKFHVMRSSKSHFLLPMLVGSRGVRRRSCSLIGPIDGTALLYFVFIRRPFPTCFLQVPSGDRECALLVASSHSRGTG